MSTWSWVLSPEPGIAGWDLGGAHLKVALFAADGRLQRVIQSPVPLWEGLERLDAALDGLAGDWPLARYDHVLTMTGELVDLFDSRSEGVDVLARHAASRFGAVRLYAGPLGFVDATAAAAHAEAIASANWYATADWVARKIGDGLLVDLGSTTADILLCRQGQVGNHGYGDRERLASEELVYTGVVRTPVMSVVQRLPFRGDWLRPANEHFATQADVYRVLGWLPADADQHPTADGRDKSVTASMRRLARMLGADLGDGGMEDWTQVAAWVADRQLDTLACACRRQISRGLPTDAPLVGAGSGRFLVERLAARLDRPYLDIDSCLPAPAQGALTAGDCAPAVAVALLAQPEEIACAC